jgi:carboxymethylenebutenolidase
MSVFVAEPDGPGPFPGIAHFHVLPGIGQNQQDTAVRIASEGYVVAIPHLYHRLTDKTAFALPGDREEANAASRSLTYYGKAMDGRAALNFLRENDLVDPNRIGVIGYCMGGTIAYLNAAWNADVKAAVVCYGPGLVTEPKPPASPTSPIDLAEWVDCPVLSLSASGDPLVPPADVEAAAARMKELGKSFVHYIYQDDNVGHAFFTADRPDMFDEGAATWGWPLKLDFLAKHLKA